MFFLLKLSGGVWFRKEGEEGKGNKTMILIRNVIVWATVNTIREPCY